jgi:hypothetical protein
MGAVGGRGSRLNIFYALSAEYDININWCGGGIIS